MADINQTIDQLKSQIDMINLPKHIAIIMDGNGRWAKKDFYQEISVIKKEWKRVIEIVGAASIWG